MGKTAKGIEKVIPVTVWDDLTPEERDTRLQRSEADISRVLSRVQAIVDTVRTGGDKALRDYTRQFDQADLEKLPLEAQPEEFTQAENQLSSELKTALDTGIETVRRFHQRQLQQLPQQPNNTAPPVLEETAPGIAAGEIARPIPSAGLYIPRGKGSFPSMLYMLALPASIAGVPQISVATPPASDGSLDSATLYTARQCGVHHVYRIGGAQAIAALAYGTESIQPTAKIEGPGSFYVTAARRLVAGKVNTGMPAGPSESIILADSSTDPETIAVDLLIEAEHGSDSSALLITAEEAQAQAVSSQLPGLIEALPQPRRDYVTQVLTQYGGIILTQTVEAAINLVNQFAPEHLMIHSQEPHRYLPLIRNAGEILLGRNTPFSAANYACGVNAVLPTGGMARTYSAVSVRDFIKYSSVVEAGPSGLDAIGPSVIALAEYEGFPAHAAAIRHRLTRED